MSRFNRPTESQSPDARSDTDSTQIQDDHFPNSHRDHGIRNGFGIGTPFLEIAKRNAFAKIEREGDTRRIDQFENDTQRTRTDQRFESHDDDFRAGPRERLIFRASM